MSTATVNSHIQEAEAFLMKAEDVRGAHKFAGDRNVSAIPLALIAQTHATLALVQTLKDIEEDRQVRSLDAH